MSMIEKLYQMKEERKPIIKSGLKDICDLKDKGVFTPKNTPAYHEMAKEMMCTLVGDKDIVDLFVHIFE